MSNEPGASSKDSEISIFRERDTQTSKTILELAQIEIAQTLKLKEPAKGDVHFCRKNDIFYDAKENSGNYHQEEKPNNYHQEENPNLTNIFLSKYKNLEKYSTTENRPIMPREPQSEQKKIRTRSFSYDRSIRPLLYTSPKEVDDTPIMSVPDLPRFTIKEIRVKTVDVRDNPTISPEQKPLIVLEKSTEKTSLSLEKCEKIVSPGRQPSNASTPRSEAYLTPTVSSSRKIDTPRSMRSDTSTARRIRSLSASSSRSKNKDDLKEVSIGTPGLLSSWEPVRPKDSFHMLLARIKSRDWDIAIKALSDMGALSETLESVRITPHMTEINQRLIECLRSPRSQVCAMSCQIAGKLFETVKDTRRPEFDDIVDVLLLKTADSNKFIRKDANVALDSMVLHIPPFHAVRAVCVRGPDHKNELVRIAAARLCVCIVGIAGASLVLNANSNEHTKKRILTNMVKFIKDKSAKTREYGMRLHKLLDQHPNFEYTFNKVVGEETVRAITKAVKEKS